MDLTLGNLSDIQDFDSISAKHWESFNNKPPKFNKQLLSNFDVVIAKDNEQTVGYIFFICFPSLYHSELWCQIDMFFLLPEYRGKGIGNKMFSLVEDTAKKRGAVKLLSSYNKKLDLSSFYSSNGFTETHVAVSKEI